MREEWPYFIKGIKKLVFFALWLTAAIAFFNVIGYLSNTYGFQLVTLGEPWEVTSPHYVCRVLSLAVFGLLQAILAVFLILLAFGVACLMYQGILCLGGYHEAMDKKIKKKREELAAPSEISEDD